MQKLFDLLLDEENTTRVEIEDFVQLINLATNDVVDSRIDPIKNARSRGIYLQAVQRVREELRTLVKEATVKTITNNIWSLPTNYKHYLLIKLDIAGIVQTTRPVTFDWMGANEDNPHTKPSDTRVKFIEKSTGIEFYYGGGAYTESNSRFEYIAEPR